MTGITEAELLAILRSKVAPFGRYGRDSITTFAYDHGFSPVTISHVLLERHGISDRLANALGYMRDPAGGFIPITHPPQPASDRGDRPPPGRPASIEGETTHG